MGESYGSIARMPDEPLYDRTRETDREAAAAYLRKLAGRLAAGEQLLPADRGDGDALQAPADVSVDLRASGGERVRVEIGLEWSPSTDEAEPDRGESEAQADGTEEDPHQSTGWASSGASSGYALPRVEGLDDAADEFERAAYFLRKGKHEAAVSRFESAVERTPRDPRRRYHVAAVCWRLGHTAKAATHFEAAREFAPEDVVITLEYASFRWSQGQISQAREAYERALDLEPDNPDVHSALGRFRWETESDVSAAVEHLKRAISIDDGHGLAHLNYAVLLRHGGKHDHAEQHFERALELRGNDPIVQKEYGHFLWERGDIEEAAKHYAKAE